MIQRSLKAAKDQTKQKSHVKLRPTKDIECVCVCVCMIDALE